LTEIVAVDSKDLRQAFIRLPWALYRDDPNWVPPLLMEERKRIGPVGGAADIARRLWIARRDGQTVGRISAQLTNDPAVGHFGFIEAIDDPSVFQGLFAAAEGWLRDRGARRALGPFNFTINEETGLLVDGFETPPMILMPHTRRSYPAHLEQLGYAKEMDLIAYRIDARNPLPRAAQKIMKLVSDEPRITLRQMRRDRFDDEIRMVLDVFNDAWSGNWGFEPFSADQMSRMAKELKPLLPAPALAVAEYDGRPVAFALGLPNLNEVIRDLDGRLLPFGWAKLLWRLKVKGVTSARVPLMGVKRKFADTMRGQLLPFHLMNAGRDASLALGYTKFEFSWVLEENMPMRRISEAMGATIYKTYRLYEKAL
jgi:hypothetical protein